jgi:DNA-binding MarR family transcriptional regulator
MRFDQAPPEPLVNAVGFLLSWNGQRMRHRFAEALEPLGLRPQHFGVLSVVAARPGTAQNELVALSMIDASTMVKVVDELEELGLAERRVDPHDRRRRAVHLTSRGEATLERARTVALQTADEVLAPLDQDEREQLRTLLRKLAAG